jgi:hypothetical protein
MRKVVFCSLALFVALAARPASADEIAKDTTVLLILNTADAFTSREEYHVLPPDTARVHWPRPFEVNPIARPFTHSDAEMYAYAGAAALAGDGLLRIMPKRWRRPAFAIMSAVEVVAISHNVQQIHLTLVRRKMY